MGNPDSAPGWNLYPDSSASVTIPLLFHDGDQYITPDFSDFTTTGTLNIRVRVVGVAGEAPDGALTAAAVTPVTDQQAADATRALVVDTGSFPTVIPLSMVQAALPDFTVQQLETYPAGSTTYSSDNVGVSGYWVPLTLAFTDAPTGGQPLTTTIKVLVTNTSDTYMMGLRFDYDAAQVKQFSAVNSAMMNLAPMADGTVPHGYIISQDGLTVGLNAANADSGWAFVKLAPASQSGDWLMPPVTVTVNGTALPAGSLLIDTGLNEMFLKYADGARLPDDSTVTLSLLGTSGAVQYSFNTGTAGGVAPSFVDAGSSDTGTFVNTGLHALAGFDILYDEENGLFGLRANGHAPDSTLSFQPVFSLSGDFPVGDGFQSSQPILLTGPATLQGPGDIALTGAISGSGTLTVQAGGTLTLGGDSTYSGGTVMNGANVVVTSTGGLGTGGVVTAADTVNTLSLSTGAVTVWSAGADTINAGAASVAVAGAGSGALTFIGGSQASQVHGGDGALTVFGGAGGGFFAAGGAGSMVVNGSGDTTVMAGGGNAIFGGAGQSLIFGGGAGDDSIVSGSGDSTIVAQSGDQISVGLGKALVFGSQTGQDTISGGGAVTVVGGNGGTQFVAAGSSMFWGGNGGDTLWGGSGSTVAVLGGGDNVVDIGGNAMSVRAGTGQDVFMATAGKAGGSAVIFDYDPGQDSLVLQGYDEDSIVKEIGAGFVTLKLPDLTTLTFVGTDASHLPG